MRNTSVSVLPAELTPHPFSIADPNGQLFIGGDCLYRGIRAEHAAFCNELFSRGVVRELIEKGLLIETEYAEISIEGYPLVLKHRRLPFVSFPFEWGAEMLRDAALLTLKMTLELLRHQLTLQDGHGWNVLWDGSSPKFIDFGSIIPLVEKKWSAEKQFFSHFYYPLKFMAAKYGHLARWLLYDGENAIQANEYALLQKSGYAMVLHHKFDRAIRRVFRRTPKAIQLFIRRVSSSLTKHLTIETDLDIRLQRLYGDIASMKFSRESTAWSAYYNSSFPPFLPDASWTLKHRTVYDILRTHQPKTVLDIGANRGWYSLLASHCGADVVAIDTDEVCINRLYLDAKRDHLGIQPLIMSFTHPTAGYGINHSLTAPATERLQCELVLALAMVHHFVFRYYLNFDHIANALAAFATHALLVEFIPREDSYVREWITERHHWYRIEKFIESLRMHFPNISILPSHPEPRVLLYCER